jgi:hypothetical protein
MAIIHVSQIVKLILHEPINRVGPACSALVRNRTDQQRMSPWRRPRIRGFPRGHQRATFHAAAAPEGGNSMGMDATVNPKCCPAHERPPIATSTCDLSPPRCVPPGWEFCSRLGAVITDPVGARDARWVRRKTGGHCCSRLHRAFHGAAATRLVWSSGGEALPRVPPRRRRYGTP